MAKTKVILTKAVENLGGEADNVEVAAGFARNYLIPQGLAVPVTRANKRQLEVLQQRRAEREASELSGAEELAKSIAKIPLHMKVRTGDDGKMFGSVTAQMIIDELKSQFEISLNRKQVHLEEPIRRVGDYEVELKLHSEVSAGLNLRVESINPLPVPEAEALAEG